MARNVQIGMRALIQARNRRERANKPERTLSLLGAFLPFELTLNYIREINSLEEFGGLF